MEMKVRWTEHSDGFSPASVAQSVMSHTSDRQPAFGSMGSSNTSPMSTILTDILQDISQFHQANPGKVFQRRTDTMPALGSDR